MNFVADESLDAEIVSRVINQHSEELLGAFTVITPIAVRIRRIES